MLQALGNGALNGEKPGRAWRSRESTVDLWIEKGSKAIPPQSATAVREVKEPPPGETLTIAEASKYLFLTPHEVREQVRAGRLPRYGKVFHITDLNRLIRDYGEERIPILGKSDLTGEEYAFAVMINGETFPLWEITDFEGFDEERLDIENRKVVWPKRDKP